VEANPPSVICDLFLFCHDNHASATIQREDGEARLLCIRYPSGRVKEEEQHMRLSGDNDFMPAAGENNDAHNQTKG
jgi:hypothetical protein